jgi:hypothetical protein
MDIRDLQINDSNPRYTNPEKFEKLKNSIIKFPKMMEIRPIIIDENNVVLGGNMRLQALSELGMKDIDDKWVVKRTDLTEEQKKEFIIKDNVGYGDWDWEDLGCNWDSDKLKEWGLDLITPEGFGTDFELPSGDKEPFQQMTFTLADKQAEYIKDMIAEIKKTVEYEYMEKNGNYNTN